MLDRLVTAFNVIAKLLHHPIQWDSETIGCEPSLSSIPAAEQRTLLTAMQELADWLAMPQNQQEFLIVFFDDQMDLASWVRHPCTKQQSLQCSLSKLQGIMSAYAYTAAPLYSCCLLLLASLVLACMAVCLLQAIQGYKVTWQFG